MLEQETGNYFNSVSNLVETFFPADMELLNHTVDKLSPLPDTDERALS
jgi:hypothetical protein